MNSSRWQLELFSVADYDWVFDSRIFSLKHSENFSQLENLVLDRDPDYRVPGWWNAVFRAKQCVTSRCRGKLRRRRNLC